MEKFDSPKYLISMWKDRSTVFDIDAIESEDEESFHTVVRIKHRGKMMPVSIIKNNFIYKVFDNKDDAKKLYDKLKSFNERISVRNEEINDLRTQIEIKETLIDIERRQMLKTIEDYKQE